MPEQPNPKLYAPAPPAQLSAASSAYAYAELDVTTNFSFLRGASHPDELVNRAAELGYRAIGVTDINSLAGIVRMHEAANDVGLKLIVGTRLTLTDAPDLLVWPSDRSAYARLCRLLTLGKRRTEKSKCQLSLQDFIDHSEGMLAALVPEEVGMNEVPVYPSSFNIHPLEQGPLVFPSESRGERTAGALRLLRNVLGDRISLVASCSYGSDDVTRLRTLFDLSLTHRVPLLATNHVHYHDANRRPLQDVITCVRHGCTISQAGFKLFPNGERYLKSPEQMHRLFADYPQAIRRGIEIAEQCNFSLESLRYEYPNELVPAGKTSIEFLTELTWTGAASHYPSGVPDRVRKQILHELDLIEQLKFEAYFLTCYDMVTFARSRGILCQGRGSAANSAVCYCIGVTSVDPAKIDVLFERFISAARNEPPDIDIDFEHERREEVIQYLYNKYGRERAGMTAEVITYRGRSAIRDVGKAMGLSLDMVDSMAKRLDWWDRGTLDDQQIRDAGLDPTDHTVRLVINLATQLLGFPRHLGQHVGGMVMTRGPLCEMVPIENAVMADRTVIEWDKDDIDAVGILKVDALALGMLTVISKAFGLIGRRHEGTKAQRHGGGSRVLFPERMGYGNDTYLQGFDRLAEGNEAFEGALPCNERDAGDGAVWLDQSNATRCDICALEHRGGVRVRESEGISETSENRARVLGRTDNTVGAGNRNEDARSECGNDVAACGNGSCITRPDSSSEKFQAPPESLIITDSPPCLPQSLELHTVPPEDPLVYDMICDADTIGVFQVESRAQMTMLPRLRPRCFYDIVIEVAIVRPGPIQGDMVHPYLRRRNGQEVIEYPSDGMREVLKKTLGVPLFQEQAMKLVMVGAGFSGDEADKLRRAMAAWKRNKSLEKFHGRILEGMLANGYTAEYAEQCFNQIKGFGEYGFPESHAASFALLVYVSAWLKRHHPAAFCAALLNSQPMGFYAPAQIVRDAKEHGVKVREIDVNASEWDCLLEESDGATERRSDEGGEERHGGTEARRHEGSDGAICSFFPPSLRRSVASSLSPKRTWGRHGPAVRLGFRQVKGLRDEHAQRIIAARKQHGAFTSIAQFHQLTHLPVAALRRLAEADCFGSLGLSRRRALWEVLKLKDEEMPLFGEDRHEGTKARRHEGESDEATKRRSDEGKMEQIVSSDPPCLRASVPPCLPPPDPPVTLPPMPIGQEVMTDYSTSGLSLKRHPVSLVREELFKRRIARAVEVLDMAHGSWIRVAGLVLIRQRPGTASGVVFETLEDESGIVNLILWPQIYDKFRPAARYAALLGAEGYVQRQGQVVHVLAKRLYDLSDLLSGLESRSRDFH